MTITLDNLPKLEGTGFRHAREWLAKLRPHATGVYFRGAHADDTVEPQAGIEAEALLEIDRVRRLLAAHSVNWPSSGVLYDIWGDKKFEAERLWPGFVNDVWTGGSRTGYVSVRGREKPNYVIEEYSGQFFLLEFESAVPASECRSFRLSELTGVYFVGASAVTYLDTTAAEVVEGTTVEFSDLSRVDEIIASIHEGDIEPTPATRGPRF
jgi:hypothetical protein